jgi:hypothetical protein
MRLCGTLVENVLMVATHFYALKKENLSLFIFKQLIASNSF